MSSAALPRRRRVKTKRRRGRTKRINLVVVLTEARHGARPLESMKTTVCRRALSAASAAVVALVDDDDDDGGGEARALSPVCSFLPLVSRDYSEEGSGD